MSHPIFAVSPRSSVFTMPSFTPAFSPQAFRSPLLSLGSTFTMGVNPSFMSTPVRPSASFGIASTPALPGLVSPGNPLGGTPATSPFLPQNPVSPAETNPGHPPTSGGWLTFNGETYNSMAAFNLRDPNFVLPFPGFAR
jgi:hypothetical protein